MKFLYFILALLMGVSLWLAYQFWPGQVIYEDSNHSRVELMGGAELRFKVGGKEVACPANYLFLGLAGTFAALMVATMITERRRAAKKAKQEQAA